MSEPKKYTAKEAMHWMIDHPGEEMVYNPEDFSNLRIYYSEGRFRSNQGEVHDIDLARHHYYVRAEYDAWQVAIKAEEQARVNKEAQEALNELLAEKAKETEPREGESMGAYINRDIGRPQRSGMWPVSDSEQRWVEAYVRREIEKAIKTR